MIPVLYDSITVGTVPTNYGRGALSDCLGYEVTEQKNGSSHSEKTDGDISPRVCMLTS